MMSDYTIRTINYVIQDKMIYQDTVVLQYRIEYPKFKSVYFHQAAESISTCLLYTSRCV